MARLPKFTRSCVSCKLRTEQKKLLRFIIKDQKVQRFDKHTNGRSFYFCDLCIKDSKSIIKGLGRIKIKIDFVNDIMGEKNGEI